MLVPFDAINATRFKKLLTPYGAAGLSIGVLTSVLLRIPSFRKTTRYHLVIGYRCSEGK
jgi:hypothetical protein